MTGPLSEGPRVAPADDSPAAELRRQLDTQLRTAFPRSYAGLANDRDGAIVVYSTGDPVLEDAVSRLQAAAKVPVPVRIASSVTNTLAVLEQLRAAVRARQPELIARGIRAGWHVDVHANRLRIAVVGLTPEKVAYLRREFGADRVVVEEGQEFKPTQ
jgi:hypothetical protein